MVDGGPDLCAATLAGRVDEFRDQHDRFRSALVNEPRGSEIIVGGLLTPPADPTCAAGVIFFNNAGYLKMCGHGMIGVVTTLAWLERIQPGTHRIETPVGVVTATLHDDGRVSLENVPSYRLAAGVVVDVPGCGRIAGHVAWGGNWFFLADSPGLELTLGNVERLLAVARATRDAVNQAGFPEVDHLEFFGPPQTDGAHSRNFVLCPGNAYDRSPCGTGTSAKLACLAADDKLAPGEPWVQESILGTRFTGSYRRDERMSDGQIIPTITGSAFVNAESSLIFDSKDPFCWGIDE